MYIKWTTFLTIALSMSIAYVTDFDQFYFRFTKTTFTPITFTSITHIKSVSL